MKPKLTLILFTLIAVNSAFAQTILSAAKTFKIEKGKYISEFKKEKGSDTAALKNLAIINSFSLLTNVDTDDKGNQKILAVTDSLYKKYTDSTEKQSLTAIVKKLNETSPFTPLLTAGVANLENTKQTYGSLSLGLQFRLSDFKVTNNKWIDPHYLYLMFSAKTATSPDSSSIQKTLIFPELNKRDFVLGYFWQFQKNEWAISPTFEFSLNRFSDTANSKSFVSQSFTTGLRVQKSFSFQNINSFVSLFPYYSLINVDKKYSEDYKELIKESKIPNTFHSLGLNASAQFPNAILFCNMKYILNKEGELKSRDLRKFVYTIGTLLSL